MNFSSRYIKYNPSITFEIFCKIWDELVELGWEYFETYYSREAVYRDFSDSSPYLEESSRKNHFQAYSSTTHLKEFVEISVAEFLDVTSQVRFKKGDPAIFIKNPTSEDWGDVLPIIVSLELGEVVIVHQDTKEGMLKFNYLLGVYPQTCFRKASVEDIFKYAKRKYPKGTKFSTIDCSSRKSDGVFSHVAGNIYSWHADEQIICCNGNLFFQGLWAPIKDSIEDLIVRAEKDYPEGTMIGSALYYSLYSIKGKNFKVNADGNICCTSTSGSPVVYNALTKKWAEIVSAVTIDPFSSFSFSLKEVQERFPIGTKFMPAYIGSCPLHYCIIVNNSFKVEGSSIIALTKDGRSYTSDPEHGSTNLNRIVYNDGKWATIVTPRETLSDEELLNFARKNYPTGTKFKAIINKSDKGMERVVSGYFKHEEVRWEVANNSDLGRNVRASNGLNNDRGGCSNPSIYSEKLGWAPRAPILYSSTDKLKPDFKYKIGDLIIYLKTNHRIVALDYRLYRYLIELSTGWQADGTESCDEGVIERGEKYWWLEESQISSPLISIPSYKYNVGDTVMFKGSEYKIAGKKYATKAYILDYPFGWSSYNKEDWDEGTFEKDKCYYLVEEPKLTPCSGKAFEIGDTVQVIANNEDYGMNNIRIGDIGTLESFGNFDSYFVRFYNRSSTWNCKANILKLVSAKTGILSGLGILAQMDSIPTPALFTLNHYDTIAFVADSMELSIKRKPSCIKKKKEIVFN